MSKNHLQLVKDGKEEKEVNTEDQTKLNKLRHLSKKTIKRIKSAFKKTLNKEPNTDFFRKKIEKNIKEIDSFFKKIMKNEKDIVNKAKKEYENNKIKWGSKLGKILKYMKKIGVLSSGSHEYYSQNWLNLDYETFSFIFNQILIYINTKDLSKSKDNKFNLKKILYGRERKKKLKRLTQTGLPKDDNILLLKLNIPLNKQQIKKVIKDNDLPIQIKNLPEGQNFFAKDWLVQKPGICNEDIAKLQSDYYKKQIKNSKNIDNQNIEKARDQNGIVKIDKLKENIIKKNHKEFRNKLLEYGLKDLDEIFQKGFPIFSEEYKKIIKDNE